MAKEVKSVQKSPTSKGKRKSSSAKNDGLVLVAAKVFNEGTVAYEDISKWCSVGEELDDFLEEMREKKALNCCRSFAEFSGPVQDFDHVKQIKTSMIHVPSSFGLCRYANVAAANQLIALCHMSGLQPPTRIDYVGTGCYMLWEYEEGLTQKELPLWRLLAGILYDTLHKYKEDLDRFLAYDAVGMMYVPGFTFRPENNSYEEYQIQTLYEGKPYKTVYELLFRRPFSVSDIEEYRKLYRRKPPLEMIESYCNFVRGDEGQWFIDTSTDYTPERRTALFRGTMRSALSTPDLEEEGYRFMQFRSDYKRKKGNEDKTSTKYYCWLNVNDSSTRYALYIDRDNWISAALFGYAINSFNGIFGLRKEENCAQSVDCNFVILKWNKSELKGIPDPLFGAQLVLNLCRSRGLPLPSIVDTVDGFELKWYWKDRMMRGDREDSNATFFNKDWNLMQETLFQIFWPLGAVKSGISTMFRVPGSLNTQKTLKTSNRVVKEIFSGVVLNSYRDMQKALRIKPSNPTGSDGSQRVKHRSWKVFAQNHRELLESWDREVFRIHPATSRNWVCVSLSGEKKWESYYVQACTLRMCLKILAESPDFLKDDIYISQGEFRTYENRRAINLEEIHVNFVDLDYKLLKVHHKELTENPTAEEWKQLVDKHCRMFSLPYPSAIVFSGGGVHLKWIYREAVTSSGTGSWEEAQELLLEHFRTLGADPYAGDLARVLRLVGTRNQKTNDVVKDRDVRLISTKAEEKDLKSVTELVALLKSPKPVCSSESSAPKTGWGVCVQRELKPEADKSISKPYKKPEQIPTVPYYERSKRRDSSKSKKSSIPRNYVVLSSCPGGTFEEQVANILKHCQEYREVGIPEPNHIYRSGSKIFVSWSYREELPYYAVDRWLVTQEYLCRYFQDWGAMDDPASLTQTQASFVKSYAESKHLKSEYSFDNLATAVLNFTRAEVKEYEGEKLAKQARRAAILKKLQEIGLNMKSKAKFSVMAYRRLIDLMMLLTMRKDFDGNVPEGTREMCVFWMLVCAKQAGLISSEEDFASTAQKFIAMCGGDFHTECRLGTLKSAYTRDYRVRTLTLIRKLQVTEEEQKALKVLKVGVERKAVQSRQDWLAKHGQEREKPWVKLGISRTTYFRRKRVGKITKSAPKNTPFFLRKKKNGTGIPYIMRGGGLVTRARFCRTFCWASLHFNEKISPFLTFMLGNLCWGIGVKKFGGWFRVVWGLMVKSKNIEKKFRSVRGRRKKRRSA